MNRRSFILTVAPALVLPGVLAHAQPAPWAEQAEREFGMGRGLGRQLMTEAEWQEHQQKMRTMTSEERARYREEMHERMRERAKEKAMAIPCHFVAHWRANGATESSAPARAPCQSGTPRRLREHHPGVGRPPRPPRGCGPLRGPSPGSGGRGRR